MQIINSKLECGDIAKNAMGGTEIMARRVASLNPELLKEFQIIVSRVEEELDPTKIRILYCHDLPGDPANDHLKDGGHEKFHKLVFVSNWQMQRYIDFYQIPWSKCIVLQNAIEPIPFDKRKWWGIDEQGNDAPAKPDKIKIIYTPTPHRGLELLVPVFDKLLEKHDNLELDVFSSFDLYGWTERNKQFQPLFDHCISHEKINYHGSKPNEVVREALKEAHIFAYPATWPETSCLCLMEAMSAGCICVHSNYGALPETAANWTSQYHFNEDKQEHAKIFYTVLMNTIEDVNNQQNLNNQLMTVKSYTDIFYSWDPNRRVQWEALLMILINQVKDRAIQAPSGKMFNYNTGG